MKPHSLVFTKADAGSPSGKLADCEIHFHVGLLAGLKLCGFGVWRSKFGRERINVTMPNKMIKPPDGVLTSFALVRPISDSRYQTNLVQYIADEYVKHMAS